MKHIMPIFLSLIFTFLLASCYSYFCNEDNPRDECPENLVCTEIFVSIIVPFEFENFSIKELDYSRTIIKSSNKEIHNYSYNKPFDMGPYYGEIVNDLHLKELQKSGTVLIYELFDTIGQKILTEEFKIGHDCCHVIKISGKNKIIL